MTFISKSKYLQGLQCSKLLWFSYNARDKIPPYDAATQAVFDQGHKVGELAKSLFPGGIEIGGNHADFDEAVRRTSESLNLRKPLFEPAFRHGNAYARADILVPVRSDLWDIVEVKSSTGVKDVYLHDMALQKYTYRGAGLDVRKCELLYIDSEYERVGEIEPAKLFAKEDVTQRVDALLPTVESNLENMLEVIRLGNYPGVSIGPWCSDPYDCPLMDICWNFLPGRSVFDLSRIGKKGFELLKKGIVDVADLPPDFRPSAAQAIQIKAFETGRPQVRKTAIREFLSDLVYPLNFLDFETFATAIPLFDHVRPYQQIPFQFSLHIVRTPGADPEHHAFIAEGKNDPRKDVLSTLIPVLGRSGSIVSYNASFEKRILSEACAVYPEYSAACESAGRRFIDLLAPFRSFYYYHPDQKASASMKEVLPALTGQGYGNMEIADGGTASREYLRVTFGAVPGDEKTSVRKQLDRYCGLDTSGMIAIVDALARLVG
jgi:hypothetical protein